MSAVTRAFKLMAAEVAYMTGNTKKADGLVTDVVAERITQTIGWRLQTAMNQPFLQEIDLAALDRGVRKYGDIRARLEAKLKPDMDRAGASGLTVELDGKDAWCSLAHSGTASVAVKISPAQPSQYKM